LPVEFTAKAADLLPPLASSEYVSQYSKQVIFVGIF